jgi:hypothetical protein
MPSSKLKVVLAILLLWWVSAMYFPDPADASYISNGSVSGNVIVTGGVLTAALPGNTTLHIQSSGSQTPVLGGENITTVNCIPFATSTVARLNCTSGFTFNNSGVAAMTNAAGNLFSLINSGGTTQTNSFEWQTSTGRTWLIGTGNPSNTSTGFAWAEYTAGVFQSIPFYLKKGGTTCIGKNNFECTTSTASFKDATTTTGSTNVIVQLGAADSATTPTITNAGTTKSAGYQSSDGTAGITGTVCVAATMQVKNGLIVAGCS